MHNGKENNVPGITYNVSTDGFARKIAEDIKCFNGEALIFGLNTGDRDCFQFPCLFAAKLSEKLSETANGVRVPLIAKRAFQAVEQSDRDLANRIVSRFKQTWELARILSDGSFELAELDDQTYRGQNFPQLFSRSITVQLGCLMKPMLGKNGISVIVSSHPREDVICIQFHGPSESRMQLK